MQLARFTQGGFVLHSARVGPSKYSAWYDRNGQLLDAERTSGPHPVSVPEHHRLVRAELARLGQRYRSIPGPVKHLTGPTG